MLKIKLTAKMAKKVKSIIFSILMLFRVGFWTFSASAYRLKLSNYINTVYI